MAARDMHNWPESRMVTVTDRMVDRMLIDREKVSAPKFTRLRGARRS